MISPFYCSLERMTEEGKKMYAKCLRDAGEAFDARVMLEEEVEEVTMMKIYEEKLCEAIKQTKKPWIRTTVYSARKVAREGRQRANTQAGSEWSEWARGRASGFTFYHRLSLSLSLSRFFPISPSNYFFLFLLFASNRAHLVCAHHDKLSFRCLMLSCIS